MADVLDDPDDPDGEVVGDAIQVANEFTTVRVRKRRTRNGERLEVWSTRLGTSILLDPLELESLTWQTTETFSRMLQDPYGPEDVDGRSLTELVRRDGPSGGDQERR